MTLDAHERRKQRKLIEDFDQLKRQVSKLNRAQDAGRTTIHGGRPIEWVDDDGKVVQRVGVGGAQVVGGEAPAQPAAPSVVSNSANDFTVMTDGEDVDDQPAPADWYRTKVYASLDPNFEVVPANFKTSIWDVAGEAVLIVQAGTWYVRIVWENQAGLSSVPSDAVSVDVAPRVDADDIQGAVDDAEAMLDDYETNTAGPRAQTLQSNLTQLGTSLEAAEGRITAAEGAIAPLASDVAAAQTAASDAQTKADQAIADALAAANLAADKGQVIVQISAPTGSRARAENLWVRLPDHKVHIYDGSSWVAATDPDLIAAAQNAADALTAANNAQSKADALEVALEGPGGLRDQLETAQDDLDNIDTELDQVATNLNTALTGPVTHDRLRAGTGAFDTGFIGELWAGNIRALAAELSSLIVAAANLIPNGDLTQGTQFWNMTNLTLDTVDVPPGYANALKTAEGQRTISSLHTQSFPVQGGKEYLFEMWIKADKPDSMFSWDMRDQNETRVGASGGSTKAIEPATGHSPGTQPVSRFTVPTTWTRIRTAIKMNPAVTSVSLRSAYFNHSAGTERNAAVSIGGIRLVPRDGAEVLIDGSVTAEKVQASREMITKLFSTEWAYVAEQLVVAGNLITQNIDAITAQLGTLSVAERANFSEAFAEEMWAALGVFQQLQAAVGWIGGTMLADDSVTTRNIVFTEELVGNIAELLHLVVDRIDVNTLWGDTAWLAAIETANVRLRSTIDDWQTIMSGRGMEVISPGGEPTVQLGNFEKTGLTLYSDGEATASMTDDGHVSGNIVSANDEFYYQGDELTDLIDQSHLPGGVVASFKRWIGNFHEQYVEERGFAEITFPVYPGRSYQIFTNPMTVHSPTSRRIYLQLRYEWGQSANLDSQLLARGATETNTSDVGQVSCSTIYHHPADSEEMTVYVLASFYSVEPWMVRGGGGGGFGDLELTAVDLGPTASEGYGYTRNIGKGRFDSGSDPTPDPPPASTPKVRRVKTYTMNWWRTWWQNGHVPSSGVGVKEAVQGWSPYFTTAGTYRSMIGFPSMTSDLSGADIEKIEVRVRVIHSHDSGGGRVRLGLHGNTSRPSSFTGHSNLELTNTHFGRGQEKWITLPSSTHAGFKNGTHRGVVLYTSSTSTTYYVQANPSRFAIRVTYRK